jgi:hypothetical protein
METKQETASRGFLQLVVVLIIFVVIVFVFKIDVKAIYDSQFVQDKIVPIFVWMKDFLYQAFMYLVNQFK